jgi:hypothetical protein
MATIITVFSEGNFQEVNFVTLCADEQISSIFYDKEKFCGRGY